MGSANKFIRRVPLVELETNSEWQVLTPKQQQFLRAYIQSGLTTGTYDALGAVLAAYGTTVKKNAKIFSYEILANPKIDRILSMHFGWNDQDKVNVRHQKSVKQVLRVVRFQLRHTEPGSTAAQRLTSQLQSLLLGTAPPEEIKTESETPRPAALQDNRIPAGAIALVDDAGVVRGYRLPSGNYVRLTDGGAEIEVQTNE